MTQRRKPSTPFARRLSPAVAFGEFTTALAAENTPSRDSSNASTHRLSSVPAGQRQRLRVAARRAGDGAAVRPDASASLRIPSEKVLQVPAAGVGGRARLWNEPASGRAGGEQRLRIYHARHQLRAARGNGTGSAA